mmetsp:Transcript_21257/g.46127  ORF Transcript_21257/g.46127 Transcript_21257/m.46127 type:complete len:115 (+) Transcript_21257:816-1160(+)
MKQQKKAASAAPATISGISNEDITLAALTSDMDDCAIMVDIAKEVKKRLKYSVRKKPKPPAQKKPTKVGSHPLKKVPAPSSSSTLVKVPMIPALYTSGFVCTFVLTTSIGVSAK